VLISAGILPEELFVCTIVDITDRKDAEEALLIKDYALHSSINAVAILNTDWTIQYVNDSFRNLMGYPREHTFTGGHAGLWFTSDRLFGEITKVVREEGKWIGEAGLQKNSRTPMYVLLSANRVIDREGRTICIMVTFIDISEKKQVETVKRKALEQIEHNIEQFAILGDHIRNSLAVIVGLSSLVPGEASDRIIGQAREIDRIVTQLDMGWIESEKVREFIRKYYQVGAAENAISGDSTT
jgi:nitrogen-specific signal transduction histidine kinase